MAAYNLKLEAEFQFDECGTLLGASIPTKSLHLDDSVPAVLAPMLSKDSNTILSISSNVVIPVRYDSFWSLGSFNANPKKDKKSEDESEESSKKFVSNPFENNSNASKALAHIISPYSHQNIVVLYSKHHKEKGKDPQLDQQEYNQLEIIVIAYYTEVFDAYFVTIVLE